MTVKLFKDGTRKTIFTPHSKEPIRLEHLCFSKNSHKRILNINEIQDIRDLMREKVEELSLKRYDLTSTEIANNVLKFYENEYNGN